MKIIQYLFLIKFLVISSISAKEIKFDKFNLKNGLEVYLVEDNRAPSIAVNLTYKIGSIDDPLGATGLAHMLEHSMFLGFEREKTQGFAEFASKNGISYNAYTTNISTAYTHKALSEKLEEILSLEADRMNKLKMIDEDFYRERNVVQEERSLRTDSNPLQLALEKLIANSYYNNPSRTPVIGWAHDIKNFTPELVRKSHDIYYSPNNAVLIVVGNVHRDKLEQLANKYFSNIPKKNIPKRPLAIEPVNKGERNIYVRHPDVTQPILLKSYVFPYKKDKYLSNLLYADLLSFLLHKDERLSGFLNVQLVEKKKLASMVQVINYSYMYKEPLLCIIAIPTERVKIENLNKALIELINHYKSLIKIEDKIPLAKALIRNDINNMNESFSGLADSISYNIVSELDPIYIINNVDKEIDRLNLEEAKYYLDNYIAKDNSVTVFLEKSEGTQ